MSRPGAQRGPVTTAHMAAARFYRKALRRNHQEPSIVERLDRAPSAFAVDVILQDFKLFQFRRASPRTRLRVAEAAYVRLAALRGVLP